MGRTVLVAATSALGAALLTPVDAAIAAPAPAARVLFSFSSEPNDFIGHGGQRFFDSAVDTVTTPNLSTSAVIVSAMDPLENGEAWTLHVGAPAGQRLAVGTYALDDLSEAAKNGVAELNFAGAGRGCSTGTGTFTVLDIASTASAVTRLDLLFEQRCALGSPAAFGELRINESAPETSTVGRHTVTWPATVLGQTSTPVAVYLENSSAAAESIGFAGADGTSATSFAIGPGSCGSSLPAHARCALRVTYTALTAGTVTSSFDLAVGGNSFSVALIGTTGYGTTALEFFSHPGDEIGQGSGQHAYTQASANIQALGGAGRLNGQVFAAGGPWLFGVGAADGDLEPGVYPLSDGATHSVSFSISGEGRGCRQPANGFIDIRQVELTAASHVVGRFDATFSQTCAGAKGALTGRIALNATPSVEQAVTPVRALDTRSGVGARQGRIPAFGHLTVALTGLPSLATAGVAGAVFNLTVVSPRAAGYLSVGAGSTVSAPSNLNFRAGQTIANLASVPLGPTRTITLYNGSSAPIDVAVDLQARLLALATGASGAFLAAPAVRIVDTRSGVGGREAPVAARGTMTVDLAPYVTGPGVGMAAALVNLTVVNAAKGGYLGVYAGSLHPATSAVSFAAGAPTSGLALVPVGSDGRIRIFNGAGAPANVIVDFQGYYTGGGVTTDPGVTSVLSPAGRVMDTRTGLGAPRRSIPPGGSVFYNRIGSPGTGAVVTLTVTDTTGSGYASISLAHATPSVTSVLNFTRGETRSNLAVTRLNQWGLVVTNHSTGRIDVIIDSVAGLPVAE